MARVAGPVLGTFEDVGPSADLLLEGMKAGGQRRSAELLEMGFALSVDGELGIVGKGGVGVGGGAAQMFLQRADEIGPLLGRPKARQ